MSALEDITLAGSWFVSSAELGHGVKSIIDGDVMDLLQRDL